MFRAQILLDPSRHKILRELARKDRKSVSEIVRELIDRYLREETRPKPDDPLDRLCGIGHDKDGATDVSEHVDEYLYGGREWKKPVS